MQYLLLIYANDTEWDSRSPEEQGAILKEYQAVSATPGVTGGAQLEPAASATTVRVQDGRTLVTDGPFVEAKEELGGFYLFEADNIDDAIEIAGRIPAARTGAVEVRPLLDMAA